MSHESKPFVHLHVHSEYSLLDGLSRIKDLARRASELGQPALALTDHGTMHGSIEFYRACRAHDIKPILGMESYLAARRLSDKEPNLDRKRNHLLLLAQNQTGYRHLLHLATVAQLEGYYYKPRIDRELLAEHSEGLITTTGCLAGEVPQAIMNGQMAKADELIGWYVDVFGPERFFIELQDHRIGEIKAVNQSLLELGRRHDLRFVATNDVHYTFASEASSHDVLLCIQTTSSLKAPNRMRMSDNGYYLKSYGEMEAMFSHVPGALSNSVLIAEMCQVDPEPPGYHLPNFDVPEGYDAEGYLRHLCRQGLEWRYGPERAANDQALRARLDHELNIIHRMGFESYFLIVWDLCQFARQADIWWNVRGSGAGSVVAYSLGITGIDPLANGLIFERFLNPGRVSMPDIDLDYPDDRRQEMIAYTVRKYGSDKVAQIITFGTMGARAAIRDVGRALEVPLSEVDALAKLIPAIAGKPASIDNVLDRDHDFYSEELAQRYREEPGVRELIDTARTLEGVARHASTHAAGVIISDKPLVEYCPLHRPTKGNDESDLSVTQWPMEIVESIGLLKVDFLGLSTLTVLRKAAELVEQRHQVHYTMENIPYDVGQVGPDPEKRPELLFELLGRGDVAGVFQVESGGMRLLMMNMKPRRFDHIIAAISLYRPGPMENIPEYIRRLHAAMEGRDVATYHHPDLEPILRDTYGILVYQEQIIRIASDLAGYEPGEADMIRKAVAKKKRKLMEEHRLKFTQGAMANGYSKEVCEAIWGDIEFFARYGFNKAHAADYAVITCQTAFLKAHYPVEYMTALLSVEHNNTEKVARYLADVRRMGIRVAPPDINLAELDFVIEGSAEEPVIRYGLGAIKNAGMSALEYLLEARRAGGPFADLADLCERVDLRKVGKRALESMIKVGTFDSWGSRSQLLEALDRIIGYSGKTHDAAAAGQLSLFGGGGFAPQAAFAPQLLLAEEQLEHRYSQKLLLAWEKELIGVYISDHPLAGILSKLDESSLEVTPTSDLDESMQDKEVRLVGMLASLRTLTTKTTGELMAFGNLEDLQGSVELVFFSRVWKRVSMLVKKDQIMMVRGRVRVDERGAKLLVEGVNTDLNSFGLEEGAGRQNNGTAESQHGGGLQAATPPAKGTEAGLPVEKGMPAAGTPARQPSEPVAEDSWPANMPPPPPNFDTPPEEGAFVPAAASLAVESGAAAGNGPAMRRRLLVEVDARGDWQATFRRTLQIAGTFPGEDLFSLALSGGKELVMDFPNHRIQNCPELLQALDSLPHVLRVVYG